VVIPLGHATVLIIYKNKTILFDPVFNTSSVFLKRYASIIDVNYLPKIDVIIYSHNHPDHYNNHDLLSLIARFPSVQIIAPLGFDIFFKREGLNYQYLTCLNWWDEMYLLDGIFKLTALPAIHWSQSNFTDRNETLWVSWMITIKNCNMYFAGDSAYGEHFKQIKDHFNIINIACLPIAPYEPKQIQFDSHMSTQESFQAFLDLGKPIFIPIHWGVFAYGDEPLKQPIQKIIKLFCDHDLNDISKLQSTTVNVPYIYQV
jgi:L-ascorbate metabolism protein UlaG (beta-lactamase superfamily)